MQNRMRTFKLTQLILKWKNECSLKLLVSSETQQWTYDFWCSCRSKVSPIEILQNLSVSLAFIRANYNLKETSSGIVWQWEKMKVLVKISKWFQWKTLWNWTLRRIERVETTNSAEYAIWYRGKRRILWIFIIQRAKITNNLKSQKIYGWVRRIVWRLANGQIVYQQFFPWNSK